MSKNENCEFMKEEVVTFLFDNGAIKIGKFTLSSGRSSSFYLDLRILQSYPIYFRKTIHLLKLLILSHLSYNEFEIICSIPTSGTIFGSALSYELFKPHSYLRKDSKTYGTQKRLEGIVPSNSKMIFIDDVVTTGKSIIEGTNTVNIEHIEGVFVIVNRSQGSDKIFSDKGIKLYSIVSMTEIVRILLRKERITHLEYQAILDELARD